VNDNYLCRHHQAKVKRAPVIDGANKGAGEFTVTGVPYTRMINTSKVDHTLTKGYFNCGCKEEEVLMEFYFWKTWSVTSPTTGATEGLMDQWFDPRARVFVVTAYQAATKLSVDDLYMDRLKEPEHKKKILQLQITRMMKEIGEIEEMERVKGESDAGEMSLLD
jgi:hypothetical protein